MAPRVQRNALLFAKGRRRRPCLARRGESRTVLGSDLEFIRSVRRAHRARRRKRLPLRRTRPARHEVSEPHRVGAKPPTRAIAAGGCLSGGKRELPGPAKTRPLTRDNSAPRSPVCLAHARVVGGDSRGPTSTPLAGESWCSEEAAPGIEGPMVVLADRFDGRSRRTARGHERPRVKSPRKRRGLAHCPLKRASGRKSVGSPPTAAKPE